MPLPKYFRSKKFREEDLPKYVLAIGVAVFGLCMFTDIGSSLKNVSVSDLTEDTPLGQFQKDTKEIKDAADDALQQAGADKLAAQAQKEINEDGDSDFDDGELFESWYSDIEAEEEPEETKAPVIISEPEVTTSILAQTSSFQEDAAESGTANSGKDLLSMQECLVVRVVDGDTFILDIEDTETKVRLIGVDTPESVAPSSYYKDNTQEGKTVSDIVKDKLQEGDLLYLEYDVSPTDKYGRTLAYLYFPDGTMVQEWLLNEGLANVATYPPNVRYADHFAELAHQAAENKTGLWEDFFKEE